MFVSFFYAVCITGIITLIFFNNIIIRGLMQKSLSYLNNVIPILQHGIADIVTSKKNSTLNVETKSIFLRWWKLMTMTCWCVLCHDDVIKWKHFPRHWPFVWERPVTRSFDVFFDLRLNKRLSKQSRGWWFETLSPHYDVTVMYRVRCGSYIWPDNDDISWQDSSIIIVKMGSTYFEKH